MDKTSNTPNFSHKRQGKGRAFVLQIIRQTIEKNTGESLAELRAKLSEEQFFVLCLRHVTTTKKAVCEAVGIPIEAGCRYKRDYEKRGLLVESVDDFICPLTRHKAKLVSTNPAEFEKLRKSKDGIQFKLFEA